MSYRGESASPIRHVVAVVVTFNTLDLLKESLEALSREVGALGERGGERRVSVVVVDNGSSDGTERWMRDQGERVYDLPCHMLINEGNLGPAKAYNQGVRQALQLDADALLLLNSDTVLTPGSLDLLWTHLDHSPEVAGVGGPLINPDGTPQRTRKAIHRIMPYRNADRPHAVTFLGTGYQLTRAWAFRRIGEYDEFYYFYNEDLDWMTRAERAGLVFHYHPDAKAIHYGGGGRKQNVSPIVRDLYRANAYYFAKFYAKPIVWLALRALRLELRLRLAREVRLLRRSDPEEAPVHQSSIETLRAAEENLDEFLRTGGLARARQALTSNSPKHL